MTDKYIKEIRVRGFQYETNKTDWCVLPVNNEGQVLYDVLGQVHHFLGNAGIPLVYSVKASARRAAIRLAKLFDLKSIKVFKVTQDDEFREVSI